MSDEVKFELFRGDVLLGVVTLAPAECEFPWQVGYLVPSPAYGEVKSLFDREAEASRAAYESDSVEAWRAADEILAEVLEPGVRLKGPQGGESVEVNGISIDGDRVGWR